MDYELAVSAGILLGGFAADSLFIPVIDVDRFGPGAPRWYRSQSAFMNPASALPVGCLNVTLLPASMAAAHKSGLLQVLEPFISGSPGQTWRLH